MLRLRITPIRNVSHRCDTFLPRRNGVRPPRVGGRQACMMPIALFLRSGSHTTGYDIHRPTPTVHGFCIESFVFGFQRLRRQCVT
jgi:hypothetical protein